MQRYDLEAVPVVNARGRLVGRITIDDVVDVIQEMADEERQLMTGVSSDVEEDDTVWKISRATIAMANHWNGWWTCWCSIYGLF